MWVWIVPEVFPPAGAVVAIALGMWALPRFLRLIRVTELRRREEESAHPSPTDRG